MTKAWVDSDSLINQFVAGPFKSDEVNEYGYGDEYEYEYFKREKRRPEVRMISSIDDEKKTKIYRPLYALASTQLLWDLIEGPPLEPFLVNRLNNRPTDSQLVRYHSEGNNKYNEHLRRSLTRDVLSLPAAHSDTPSTTQRRFYGLEISLCTTPFDCWNILVSVDSHHTRS